MGGLVEAFPVFPLGIVVLPHERVPLHVFEQRYRAMVARCLDEELEFAVVWAGEESMRATGCACAIEQVVRRYEDGRLDLVARGTRPVRLRGELDAVPWPAGGVELLDDRPEEPSEATRLAAHEAYAALLSGVTGEGPEPERLAAMGAYAMAATVELGLGAKQGLLDMRSENARLRLVARLFRDALGRLDRAGRARARAASNGTVRFG